MSRNSKRGSTVVIAVLIILILLIILCGCGVVEVVVVTEVVVPVVFVIVALLGVDRILKSVKKAHFRFLRYNYPSVFSEFLSIESACAPI